MPVQIQRHVRIDPHLGGQRHVRQHRDGFAARAGVQRRLESGVVRRRAAGCRHARRVLSPNARAKRKRRHQQCLLHF